MRTFFITGGAGFIGSAFVRLILTERPEYKIINFDALTYAGNLDNLNNLDKDRHTFIRGDIAVAEQLLASLPEKCDAILNFAAESHVDRSITGAVDFIQTNVIGTFSLLEAARDYWAGLDQAGKAAFRFLHVSTDEVYGSLGDEGLFTEDTPYDPSSPYSASKASSDHLAKAWERTYGLPVVVSNCSNNYGPYHFPEKLIPLTILNALAGERLPVYGKGDNVRDWLYVEDHARALDLIAEQGRVGETYNVGGRNERLNIDVVRRICSVLDQLVPGNRPRDELIEFVTDRPGHDARYAIDATKLENELGWQARENFDTGIEKTVQWYLDNEWWWRPLRERYAGERLGLLKSAKA